MSWSFSDDLILIPEAYSVVKKEEVKNYLSEVSPLNPTDDLTLDMISVYCDSVSVLVVVKKIKFNC